MYDVFRKDEEYQKLLDEFLNSPRHTIDKAREIRNRYKYLVGAALFKLLPVRFRTYIMDNQNQVDLCKIAEKSALFSHSSGTLRCILREINPNSISIPRSSDSKAAFNRFFRCAWREARTIKKVYALVAEQDSTYSKEEFYKLKKALLFIKIVVITSLHSKLSTTISPHEYDFLVSCCNEQIVSKRYRFDAETGQFIRIGGQNKKRRGSAFNCFDGKGTTMFIKKAVLRWEKKINAFH